MNSALRAGNTFFFQILLPVHSPSFTDLSAGLHGQNTPALSDLHSIVPLLLVSTYLSLWHRPGLDSSLGTPVWLIGVLQVKHIRHPQQSGTATDLHGQAVSWTTQTLRAGWAQKQNLKMKRDCCPNVIKDKWKKIWPKVMLHNSCPYFIWYTVMKFTSTYWQL